MSSYMVTGATVTQQPFPQFLTGRIHSQPNLETQDSTQTVSMETTLPMLQQLPHEQISWYDSKLAEPIDDDPNITATPVTFDHKTEKFELFEDLFHTML